MSLGEPTDVTPEQEDDEYDPALVDWRATAENLQREVTRLKAQLPPPTKVFRDGWHWLPRASWTLAELNGDTLEVVTYFEDTGRKLEIRHSSDGGGMYLHCGSRGEGWEDIAAAIQAAMVWTDTEHCPTCDSPQPHLHPAVQFEGEVQPCKDPWHAPRPS
jgi:hypothetical protein